MRVGGSADGRQPAVRNGTGLAGGVSGCGWRRLAAHVAGEHQDGCVLFEKKQIEQNGFGLLELDF